MALKYQLRCLECGKPILDRYTNTCPRGHDALLRTAYKRKQVRKLSGRGLFNYLDWLPVEEALPLPAVASAGSSPVAYKSEEGLGRELGLNNLFVAFNGYWPEKGAFMKTCTFKELEAAPTFQRAKEKAGDGGGDGGGDSGGGCGGKILVVPSAGNTSRAFAEVAALTGMPVVAVVPKSCLHRMWTTVEPETETKKHDNIFLISVDGDYSDAIAVGKDLVQRGGRVERGGRGGGGLIAEGGARNVARRDGMGVVELEAAFFMKVLPDYYFQAVGSGTGAIAAWEAFSRLLGDGRFGGKMPKIVISQNLPFAPMFYAWQDGRRAEIIAEKDMKNAEEAIKKMYADVLSTRNPPYSVRGGVYEMLKDTNGEIYGVTNDECREAEKLFESEEGVDLDPAASVAVASLIKAVEEGFVGKEERVLLNITGGGYKRLREECKMWKIKERLEIKSPSQLPLPLEEVEGVILGELLRR